MTVKNKGWFAERNRNNIKSHLTKYYKELRVDPPKYLKPDTLHLDCSLRSPSICKASDDIKEIEFCGEIRKFCTSCANEMQFRFKKALEKPQMHYWQVNGNLIKK